jgi:hypothetical protein
MSKLKIANEYYQNAIAQVVKLDSNDTYSFHSLKLLCTDAIEKLKKTPSSSKKVVVRVTSTGSTYEEVVPGDISGYAPETAAKLKEMICLQYYGHVKSAHPSLIYDYDLDQNLKFCGVTQAQAISEAQEIINEALYDTNMKTADVKYKQANNHLIRYKENIEKDPGYYKKEIFPLKSSLTNYLEANKIYKDLRIDESSPRILAIALRQLQIVNLMKNSGKEEFALNMMEDIKESYEYHDKNLKYAKSYEEYAVKQLNDFLEKFFTSLSDDYGNLILEARTALAEYNSQKEKALTEQKETKAAEAPSPGSTITAATPTPEVAGTTLVIATAEKQAPVEQKETKAAAQSVVSLTATVEQKGKAAEVPSQTPTIATPITAVAPSHEIAGAASLESTREGKDKDNQKPGSTSPQSITAKPLTAKSSDSKETVSDKPEAVALGAFAHNELEKAKNKPEVTNLPSAKAEEKKNTSSVLIDKSFIREAFINKVKLKIDTNRKVYGKISEAIIVDHNFIEKCVTGVLAADKMLHKNHYQNLFDASSRKDFIKECTKEIEQLLSNGKGSISR